MKTPQTREIDGYEYTVAPMPAMRSIEVLRKVGAILGPAFADFGAALEGAKGAGGMETDVNLSKLGAAFGHMLVSLGEGQFAAATRDGLLVGCTVMEEGRRVELMSPKGFDDHFAGSLPRLFKVLAFCAEVQYGDFSEALKRGLARMGAGAVKAPSLSTSPST